MPPDAIGNERGSAGSRYFFVEADESRDVNTLSPVLFADEELGQDDVARERNERGLRANIHQADSEYLPCYNLLSFHSANVHVFSRQWK